MCKGARMRELDYLYLKAKIRELEKIISVLVHEIEKINEVFSDLKTRTDPRNRSDI
jgi:hypothetical protein